MKGLTVFYSPDAGSSAEVKYTFSAIVLGAQALSALESDVHDRVL